MTDLAQAHVLGLEYLLRGGKTDVFNLGNGNGFSVREVIDTALTVTGRSFSIVEAERRLGDPPILVGSAQKARAVLNWEPVRTQLEVILEDAWRWHQRRHG